jgi:hypothetical protein
MRAAVTFPALAMLVGIGACAPGGGSTRGDDALARELAERNAGPARDCVPIRAGSALRAVDRQTITYRQGGTLWVSRLAGPCPGLRDLEPIIVEPTGSQYCRGDRIRSLEPGSTIPGPTCILESFVPYRR